MNHLNRNSNQLNAKSNHSNGNPNHLNGNSNHSNANSNHLNGNSNHLNANSNHSNANSNHCNKYCIWLMWQIWCSKQEDTMHRRTSCPPTMAFNMRVTTPCLLLCTGLCHTSTYLWGLTDQILYLSAVSIPPSLDLGLFHGVKRSRDVMLHVVCLVTVDMHYNFSATRQTLTQIQPPSSIGLLFDHQRFSIACGFHAAAVFPILFPIHAHPAPPTNVSFSGW